MAEGKEDGCTWENKSQPLQSGLPKRILDNISLLCFHDKPRAGGMGAREYEKRGVEGAGGAIKWGVSKEFLYWRTKENKNLFTWPQTP